MFKASNIKEIKSTIIGLVFLFVGFFYFYKFWNEIDFRIFFALLGIGISLLFVPDSLFNGLKSFINKNKNKEI